MTWYSGQGGCHGCYTVVSRVFGLVIASEPKLAPSFGEVGGSSVPCSSTLCRNPPHKDSEICFQTPQTSKTIPCILKYCMYRQDSNLMSNISVRLLELYPMYPINDTTYRSTWGNSIRKKHKGVVLKPEVSTSSQLTYGVNVGGISMEWV